MLLTFILLYVFSVFINAQAGPTYRERAGKIVSMSNLVGNEPGWTCKGSPSRIGTIVKRDYLDDEITISGFVLKSANDERKQINIDTEHLRVWGRETNRMVSEMFSLNSKVRVNLTECSGGGSGVFLFVKQIVKY